MLIQWSVDHLSCRIAALTHDRLTRWLIKRHAWCRSGAHGFHWSGQGPAGPASSHLVHMDVCPRHIGIVTDDSGQHGGLMDLSCSRPVSGSHIRSDYSGKPFFCQYSLTHQAIRLWIVTFDPVVLAPIFPKDMILFNDMIEKWLQSREGLVQAPRTILVWDKSGGGCCCKWHNC